MSYSCFNRPPFEDLMIVQDGWHDAVTEHGEFTRTPRMKVSPFRMARDCQYQKDDKYNDPQCVGCKHKEVKHEG